jgi:predicted PurR-regulated permease PerM
MKRIQINPIFNDLEEYMLNNNKVLRVIIVVMLVAVVLALILTSVVPLVN